MRAKTVMLQGTSSHVGKSILTTALCRILHQDGHRVVPFKAQNMALNAYVTWDGGEIGRAQGLQAEAAGVRATVDMNPILLKPKGDSIAEVILGGRSAGDYSAVAYRKEFLPFGRAAVGEALAKLRATNDLVVIEGAGSPAEVNLRETDIANMYTAKVADAPVILVGDIDRGGVLAALVGTLDLLTPAERSRIKGLIINKFRGDFSLLQPALTFLAERTGVPVLGVLPFLRDLGLEEEDSLGVALPPVGREVEVDVAVIGFPHLANFSDLDPLGLERGLGLRYVTGPGRIGRPDALILPGSKNTMQDLAFLEVSGLREAIRRAAAAGTEVVGLCGGYQSLGEVLHDPEGWEDSPGSRRGLDLLPAQTVFKREKTVCRTSALFAGETVEGYEIHRGQTVLGETAVPTFLGEDGRFLGGETAGGMVWGTYLHGLFENDKFRRSWHNRLRKRVGLLPLSGEVDSWRDLKEERLDRLAQVVRESLDMETLSRIIELK